MQYTTLALAFVASAYAQTDDFNSVVSVLVTALPSSLVQEYETNSAAVASEISSAFAAGNTPSWFEALPTAVQTYLIPEFDDSSSTANAPGVTSSVSGAPTGAGTTGNSTLATTRRTPSVTSTTTGSDSSESSGSGSGDSTSSSDSSSTGTSSGGASLPTAVVGMGFAGAAGLVGLLAL